MRNANLSGGGLGVQLFLLVLLIAAGAEEAASQTLPFSVSGSVPSTWGWVRRDVPSPFQRHDHGMAYDQARATLVVFGGTDAAPSFFSDLWEWDGVTWLRKEPATSLAGRKNEAAPFPGTRPDSQAWD